MICSGNSGGSIGKLEIGVQWVDAAEKKIRVLKDPTDYMPASNSYPVKSFQRDGHTMFLVLQS